MSRIRTLLLAAVVIALAGLAVGTTSARAGVWEEFVCDGASSAGSADGWQGSPLNSTTAGAVSTACDGNTPPTAKLTAPVPDGTVPSGATETITWTPPSGSELAGGFLDFGYSELGQYGEATLWAGSMSASDVVLQYPCEAANTANDCPDGNLDLALPANTGGSVIVQAACTAPAGSSCPVGYDGTVATASGGDGVFDLQSDATPTGTAFSGSALGTVAGTGTLQFTAGEASGPGIYNVTVAIDGTAVYDSTPDTNAGACVPAGKDTTNGALEFNSAQPCPLSETVNATVPTAATANGVHALTVTVTDAAGNTATVLSEPITIANPVATPPTTTPPVAPTAPARTKKAKLRRLDEKLVVGWDARQPRTRLKSLRFARHAKLPAGAQLAVSCTPRRDCPKFRLTRVKRKHAARLLRELTGAHFRTGAALQLMITAPHRRAERVVFDVIGKHRTPVAHVYYGKAKPTATKTKTKGTKTRTKRPKTGASRSADGRRALATATARRAAAAAADRGGADAAAGALRAAGGGRAGAAGADRRRPRVTAGARRAGGRR